jgi:flagellar hook-associated protein 3 FlgL
MRVTFGQVFRNGLADINRAAADLARWQRQVSSGRRVHVPSDDPSAAAAVVGEKTELRVLDQYVKTVDTADSRLRVVDSALTDIIKNLTAAQTTAGAGRNSFLTGQQRLSLGLQLRGIRDAVLSDLNSQYANTYLFSGSALTQNPFSKNGAGVVQPYAGNATISSVDIGRNQAAEVTIDGGAVTGTLFADLDALIVAVETGNMAGIDTGMTALTSAFDRFTNAQSRVGNTLAYLTDQRARLGDSRLASDARRSTLEDANLAEAISGMQAADTAHRAALGAVSSAGRLSLLDYLK